MRSFVSILLLSSTLAASVLYDTLPPLPTDVVSFTIIQFGHDNHPLPRTMGAPFVLSSDARLETLTSWMLFFAFEPGPLPTALRILVLNDDGGLPGTTVLDQFVLPNPPFEIGANTPADFFSMSATNGAVLTHGVRYWLLPVLDVADGSGVRMGFWKANGPGVLGVARDIIVPNSAGTAFLMEYFPNEENAAFRLTGQILDTASVPEPGTLALGVSSGLVLLLARRRRYF